VISLGDALRHPATALTVVVSALAQVFQLPFIDAVLGVLWGQVSVLFTGTSIFAFTVLPNVEAPAWLASNVQLLAIVLGVAYALKLLSQVFEKITEEVDG